MTSMEWMAETKQDLVVATKAYVYSPDTIFLQKRTLLSFQAHMIPPNTLTRSMAVRVCANGCSTFKYATCEPRK